MPALIRKFHEAKLSGASGVTVWGTGTPLREFMHVDDLADACVFLMNLDDGCFGGLLTHQSAPALINVGSGQEISIADLAIMVKRIAGFDGEILFDAAKPDGTLRKLADSSRIHSLGWKHRIELEQGVQEAYGWYMKSLAAQQDTCSKYEHFP